MLRTAISLLSIFSLAACEVRPPAKPGPKDYLTLEYFRQLEICDQRAPRARSAFQTFDVGPRLHQDGRPATWKAQKVYLGETCYVASAGPVYYDGDEQPSYYSLDVEVRIPSGGSAPAPASWLVLFGRDIPYDDLPTDADSIEIRDIVSFSESRHTVSFEIGRHRYEYRLPVP